MQKHSFQSEVKDFAGISRGTPVYLQLRLRETLWFKNALCFDLLHDTLWRKKD